MKKILISLLVITVMMAFSGCQSLTDTPSSNPSQSPVQQTTLDKIKAAGEIVMATSPDYAPYEFIDLTKDGQESYVGSDIELGKYIAEKLGVTLKIDVMDFTAVQTAVSMGAVDFAISGFAYTDERAESMLLSDFYNTDEGDGQGILVLKANADKFKTTDDFEGKKVAAQNGSLQYNLVSEQLPNAVIEPVTNINDAIMMLKTGKVDAVAVSGTNGEAYVRSNSDLIMSNFYFEYSSEGVVIALPKGSNELLQEINKILKDVNDNKLYQKWLDDATELAARLGIE